MHGRIQKIMWGGGEGGRGGGGGGGGLCHENFNLVFHRGQCQPGLPFEAIGPKGPYLFSGLSITVFLRKPITACNFPGGDANPLSPTLGTDTCDA